MAAVIGCGPSSKPATTVVRVPEAGPEVEKKDDPEAAELKKLRQRCEAGEAARCLEYGEALQAADNHKAGSAFLRACSTGDAEDCVAAAERCNDSVPDCGAIESARTACLRDPDLCERAADAVRAYAERELERDAADELVAFECVVSGESFETCSEQVAEVNRVVFEESTLAWLLKSCEWNRARCYRHALIAVSIDAGSRITKDVAKQAMHVSESCRFGDPVECVQEGFAFLRGDERSVDRDMAEVLFAEGCNAGEPWGCTALADMYRKDEGSQKKRLLCTSLYEQACEGGDPEACWKLGKLFLKGLIVAQDITRASGLFRRACELGNQAGCDFFGDN